MQAAQRRLETARVALASDPASALSLAYYAMLYAARAALSEHDKYAKTHAGTWHLFQEEFVDHGSFDATLLADARNTQPKREDADYQAWLAPTDVGAEALALATSFVAAVNSMLES